MSDFQEKLSKEYKVLSVHQPWAWLIVHGYKDIENRSWKTDYRGYLYIHAGLKFDKNAYYYLKKSFIWIDLPDMNQFNFGGIVGKVELVDCLERHNSVWYKEINNKEKTYAWLLANPHILKFYPLKGRLGLFTIY